MENIPTPQTITRAYLSFEDARNVVVRLANAGIAPDRIGLLGHQVGGDEKAAIGAGMGGAAGAATGFIIGLGALTLPGVGPIIAAGWFLSGAVAGAFAGGAMGAFIDAGLSRMTQRHMPISIGSVPPSSLSASTNSKQTK
jgi:hypothetical protein